MRLFRCTATVPVFPVTQYAGMLDATFLDVFGVDLVPFTVALYSERHLKEPQRSSAIPQE